jgi:DNA-binding NarL/FixJ family response regulator
MPNIRIVIVDSHPHFRRALRRLLRTELGVEVVGEGENFGDAMKLVFELRPDVAIVDLSMPAPKNFRAADFAALSKRWGCATVAMSIWVDEEAETYAKSLGAVARIDKVYIHETLIPKIFAIIASKSKPKSNPRRADFAVS